MIGIKLTLVCNRLMNSMSTGFNLSIQKRSTTVSEKDSSKRTRCLRVTSRFDKVETSVNSVIYHLLSVHSVLLFEVGIKSSFDIVENRLPSVRQGLLLSAADKWYDKKNGQRTHLRC